MEEWKDIPGFWNLYQASSEGRIKSLPKYVTLFHGSGYWTKEKILKPRMTEGYLFVALFRNGKRFDTQLHRLIAKSFKGMPNARMEVNHKDGNKLNNAESNLEWCTHQQNVQHAYDNNLMTGVWKGATGLNHPGSKKVSCTATGRTMCVKEAAKVSGYSETHMCSMLQGKRTNKTTFIYN